MKKVLIVTYSFPPLNNIASRRFGEMVPFLKDNGWEPHILTTNSNGTLPTLISGDLIKRFGHHPQSSLYVKNNIYQKGILHKILNIKRSLGFTFRMFDRTYFNWYKDFKEHEEELLKDQKFDLIVASFGPGASLYIGKYLSKKYKIPWIADFRDLGALYKDKRTNVLFREIDKVIEKVILNNVSTITSIGDTFNSILYNAYQKPTYTIFNGWNQIDSLEGKTTVDSKQNQSNYIYYAGRLYPHQMKSLFKLIKVLKYNKNIKLILRSLGPKDLDNKIIHFAQLEGVGSNQIELLPPVDQETVLKEAQASFANLVIEDLDNNIYWKKGTLTGKFLGLLPLHPPILAIARVDSEIGEILKKTSRGKLCSNEETIEKFLKSINLENYSITKKIDFYSKENQALEFVHVLNNTIQN